MAQQRRPLEKRFLTDKEAEFLYLKYPELNGDFERFCPTCAKHGTYKWKGEIQVCDCQQQLQLHKHYLNANIGVLYQRQSWDDFHGDPDLKDIVQLYLENSERMVAQGVGIIFRGEYGVGKTMAISLLLKDLLKRGHSVFSITFSGMISMFTAGWDSKEDRSYFQEKVRQSKILLLDDLGKEMRTKTNLAESTFDDVLRSRAQQGRPTFITTNMSEKDMSVGYGHAVMSLLQENSLVYEATGDDFRTTAGKRTMQEILSGETRPIF